MRVCIAVALAVIPVTLSAQRPDTTMIPRALANALISLGDYMGGRDPQIVVGRVPDERLAALVPPSARVLGGVTYPNQRNSQTTTILSMPERPDSALVLVGARLESAGFKPAPTFESARGESGGFTSSSMGGLGPGMPGSMLSYCGSDSTSVTASITDGENRGSMVRLMSSRSPRNTMCDPRMRARLRGFMEEEIELPTLRPPTGATGGQSGMSGSDDSRETRALLRSNLGAVEMIDHFVVQLREQGWTLNNRATDGDLSVQTARRTDKKGEPLYLILADNRYGPRDHDVTLRVWKQSRER